MSFQELLELEDFKNMYEAATFALFQVFETQYDILLGSISNTFRYSYALMEFYPFSCLFSIFYILCMLMRYFSTRPEGKCSVAYYIFLGIQILSFIGYSGFVLLDEQRWENQ